MRAACAWCSAASRCSSTATRKPPPKRREFAADHGKFWELHDTLFEHQRALDEPHLLGYVRALGLDDAALAETLREHTYAGIIDDVKQGGEDSGIPGTPAFFLNGVLFEDDPARENFVHAIDWLLERGDVR